MGIFWYKANRNLTLYSYTLKRDLILYLFIISFPTNSSNVWLPNFITAFSVGFLQQINVFSYSSLKAGQLILFCEWPATGILPVVSCTSTLLMWKVCKFLRVLFYFNSCWLILFIYLLLIVYVTTLNSSVFRVIIASWQMKSNSNED